MKHFFNTCKVEGVGLQIEEDNAKTQEKAILQIFKIFSELKFRTIDIEDILKSHKLPHNHDSVKRAINRLTFKGFLDKSEKADCPGPIRGDVHTWQYKGQSDEIAA